MVVLDPQLNTRGLLGKIYSKSATLEILESDPDITGLLDLLVALVETSLGMAGKACGWQRTDKQPQHKKIGEQRLKKVHNANECIVYISAWIRPCHQIELQLPLALSCPLRQAF